MDMADLSQSLREELTCAICLEYFMSPVTIDCGHSFCQVCLNQTWEETDGPLSCPECKEIMVHRDFKPNHRLGKLARLSRQLHLHSGSSFREETRCERHHQVLKLFCSEEQIPICVACSQSREHTTHRIAPIKEAAQEIKEELQSTLESLWNYLEEVQKFLIQERSKFQLCTDMVASRKHGIRVEFEKMRRFLVEEEKFHVWLLTLEEKRLLQKLGESEARACRLSSSLRQQITELEEECEKPDIDLLRDGRSLLNRIEPVILQMPEAVSLDLRSACRVLGMREMLSRFQAVNVTLDLNTANPRLVISEDRRSVALAVPKQEHNSENSSGQPFVLGSTTLFSGNHYWEVEVGRLAAWALGVCTASVKQRETTVVSPACGFWVISRENTDTYTALSSPETPLMLRSLPRKVGIFLEYAAGNVSFYNITDRSHIFNFSSCSFSGPVRPYFSILPTRDGGQGMSLTITPVDLCR
ncbi:E3 ubiquitin-protein ligase TRIM11-like [Tachyglossus aculeatus]|uniref:E3 ubiquitin-protein ligase TRIM11-like n=1 Tax=Tachyglossus aculeatus TaxID=9261 RepID=UPI0018F56A04|nr:E3 ubiquitin-protein ligase TRIM11-like [Tachyglossus aculeatus]